MNFDREDSPIRRSFGDAVKDISELVMHWLNCTTKAISSISLIVEMRNWSVFRTSSIGFPIGGTSKDVSQ